MDNQSSQMKYTKLADTVPDKKTKYYIAGIIIDATQPYKTSKNLIVSLKIVDPSISFMNEDEQDMDVDEETAILNSNKIFRSVSIFNNNQKSEMPLVRNVGDIIFLRVR